MNLKPVRFPNPFLHLRHEYSAVPVLIFIFLYYVRLPEIQIVVLAFFNVLPQYVV